MRTTTLLTVASLFLIGSYSLPQPEGNEASRAIENREANDGPSGPFPGHNSEGWRHSKHHGGDPGASNTTKIKERQTHPGYIISQSTHTIIELISSRWPNEHHDNFHHEHGGDRSPTANATKIKEREEYPPAGHEFSPPDGMTWQEFIEYEKHKHGYKKGGSASHSAKVPLSTGTSSTSGTEDLYTGTGNSTKVRMLKFKD
ncbi:hypothetical protein BDR22DRAFT_958864 [Usnea florida]